MTVNDVNQSLRNLMVSQPMMATGPLGVCFSSALNIIDGFKAFSMSVSAYPVQDSLKYNMTTELARLDGVVSNIICQSFQEKGVNLLAFMPMGQMNMMPQSQPMFSGANPMQNNMMYNQPQQRFSGAMQSPQFDQYNPVGGYPNQRPMYNANQPMQSQMMNSSMQQPLSPRQGYPMQGTNSQSLRGMQKTMPIRPMQAPRQPKPFNYGVGNPAGFNTVNFDKGAGATQPEMQAQPKVPEKPVKVEPKEAVIPTPVAGPTNAVKNTKSTKKPAAAFLESQDIPTTPTKDLSKKGEESEDETPPSNAAGRDYLLQLLKK